MGKRGLVLEGGALRGLFSAGVTDVLMEHGICFDGLVGVSAGAAFGCNYKSRQQGRAIRYNKRFARDRRYCSWRSWWKTGDLFNGSFCYHYLPTHLDIFDEEAFNANPMEFYAVCTDVETGNAVYQRLMECSDECYDYIRASASMPFVSKVVELNGSKLLDGGVADSIPLAFFQKKGYERNVVVLTQPEGYRKQHNRLMPLMRVALRKYPQMVHAMDIRHKMYNRQLLYVKEQEAKGLAYVIRPPERLRIGHLSHNPAEMEEVYQVGLAAGRQHFEAIQEFLKK